MRLRPPSTTRTDTRFPYTTLVRSRACRAQEGAGRGGRWRALPVTTILFSRRSWPRTTGQAVLSDLDVMRVACIAQRSPVSWRARSEEHTSELQSLMRIPYAVFCLKKKKNTTNNHTHK